LSGARKLAAILAVDIAGYSRLMGEDEAGTAKAVRERREAAMRIVRTLGGRLVKTTGDGLLLEFPSVVAGVECAILTQKMMAEWNAALPETKRILYRIGVNLGDVLIEGDDIFGDGVNVAARLEGLCEPGGVCASSSAYEQFQGRVSADFSDLGDQSLKNIVRRVRVYALSPAAVTEARVEEPEPASGSSSAPPASVRSEQPRLSIVVLPFANIGGDPEQDYFVDGVTGSLTTDLSRISAAFVIARSTAFAFKGKPIDVRAIGRELNVRYALEGSVQRRGDRMRVNVQLVETESGTHLWAERFDKPVTDFLDMQDEIVARLANQLSTELLRAEASRSEKAASPDSFDLVLQGLAWMFKERTLENLARARNFFERALRRDPDNVGALVPMAFVDFIEATAFRPDDLASRLAAAEAAATKALSLAPENARAHECLGSILSVTKRGEQAIAQCEMALAINPNLANAHATIGWSKAITGRAEETEAHVQEAFRLSPRDTGVSSWMYIIGGAKGLLGRHEEAIAWFRRSIEANRTNPSVHFHLAASLALMGRLEEARAAAAAGLALNPKFTIAWFQTFPFGDNPTYLGGRNQLVDGMRKAGLPEGAMKTN
jgi:TolB-like protein/class 3 adenylate cyclase